MNAKKPGVGGKPAAPTTHSIHDNKKNFVGAGNSPPVNKIPIKLSSNILDERPIKNQGPKYGI